MSGRYKDSKKAIHIGIFTQQAFNILVSQDFSHSVPRLAASVWAQMVLLFQLSEVRAYTTTPSWLTSVIFIIYKYLQCQQLF